MKESRIDHEMLGAIDVVRVTGTLDLDSIPRFENLLTTLLQQRHFAVLLDCKDLDYISTVGLGALVGFTKRCRENSGDLKLVHVPERVYRIIDLLGFTKVLQVYHTEAEALASFAKN